MKIENIFISVFLFVMIMSVVIITYSNMATDYQITPDNTKLGKMTQSLQSMNDVSDDMKSNIQGENIDDATAEGQMLKGGYGAVKNNPFKMATFVFNVTNQIGIETGFIEPIFIKYLQAIIIILLIMAIIYLIFRYNPR